MSDKQSSPLHKRVHVRFCEAFGSPDMTLGRDDHWSLVPIPGGVSINLMVDGVPDMPAVWVFDPHDRKDGVMQVGIKSEEHLEEVISQIEDRVKRASAKGSPEGGEVDPKRIAKRA